jgi:hypothetical protein
LHNRQPTLPQVGGSPEISFAGLPPIPRTVLFDVKEPSQTYQTDPALMGIHPAIRPLPARQTGVFYERRKLPPPPSMRRNQPPPLTRHNRSYSAGSLDGNSPTDQPEQGSPGSTGAMNGVARDGSSPPSWGNPSNGEFVTSAPPLRSYTMGESLTRPPPGAGSFVPAGQRRVRRSMSLGGMSSRYRNPFVDPLSMHPIIQEVPSGQNSPMREMTAMNFQSQTHPESLQPGNGQVNTANQGPRDRPSPKLWDRPDSSNRILTVRNIPSPHPSPSPAEKNHSPLNNMKSRMGSLRDHQGFRVQDAAKNF